MYKLFVCLSLVNCVMNRQNERITIIELHKSGMKTLTRAWDEITVEECATIIGNFRKRLRKCIEAEGGHFEHLL